MKQFALRLGIDRAVFFTLLGRSWNVGAGLLIIAVVAYILSPEIQGYYYTFSSLIALQIFAELGLSFAIIQFASHEMAQLSWLPDGTVDGDPKAKCRLQSLFKFSLCWFGVAATLMVIVLLPLGIFFFDTAKLDTVTLPNIAIPWSLLVIFTAINLFIIAAAAILEGCGKVAHVAVLRFLQSLCAMSMVLFTLGLGGQLYALVISSVMMVLVGFVWLRVNYWKFFKDLLAYRSSLVGLNWREDVWPFQWRIAVSWMSGYFIFQLFTPLIFKTHGAIAAGQMGMSLQIINAMNSVAMAWISTKAPIYGQLIATNQRQKLDVLFFRGFVQSFVFLIAGVALIWLGLFYITHSGVSYIGRILPLQLFSFLCLACLANHIVSAEATYLRAHKEEPFIWLSLSSGLMTAILAILLVPALGLGGAVFAYTATTLSISLVGGTFIFLAKRKNMKYESL